MLVQGSDTFKLVEESFVTSEEAMASVAEPSSGTREIVTLVLREVMLSWKVSFIMEFLATSTVFRPGWYVVRYGGVVSCIRVKVRQGMISICLSDSHNQR